MTEKNDETQSDKPVFPKKIGSCLIDEVLDETDLFTRYLGYIEDTRQWTIIKAARKTDGDTGISSVDLLLHEYSVLQSLDHPAIISLVGEYSDEETVYLIEEHVATGMLLSSYLDMTGRTPEEMALGLLRDVADALVYMQGKPMPVIHRHLNPSVLMLTCQTFPDQSPPNGENARKSCMKIIDFSTAVFLDEEARSPALLPRDSGYIPPDEKISFATDVYSFGAILFRMLTGVNHVQGMDRQYVMRTQSIRISEPTIQLVEDCMASDVSERISDARELLHRMEAVKCSFSQDELPPFPTVFPQQDHESYKKGLKLKDESDEESGLIDSFLDRLSHIDFFIIIIVITLLFMSMRGEELRKYHDCVFHVKELGADLDRYAREHSGKYPPELKELVPRYIKGIPTCPGAGKDTYSAAYEISDDRRTYTLQCEGYNHKMVVIHRNYPQFSSTTGLIPDKGKKERKRNPTQ